MYRTCAHSHVYRTCTRSRSRILHLRTLTRLPHTQTIPRIPHMPVCGIQRAHVQYASPIFPTCARSSVYRTCARSPVYRTCACLPHVRMLTRPYMHALARILPCPCSLSFILGNAGTPYSGFTESGKGGEAVRSPYSNIKIAPGAGISLICSATHPLRHAHAL